MLPSLFRETLETSSVGSSWKDLSNDLKVKIIDSFARASKTTSCEQVITLCEDAQSGEDEYKKLFLIQVNKLNWPPVRESLDKTLVIPNDKDNWKDAYAAECTNFNAALATVKKTGWSFSLRLRYKQYENNRDFILATVAENGLALKHASEELQNDQEIVLLAVKNGFIF